MLGELKENSFAVFVRFNFVRVVMARSVVSCGVRRVRMKIRTCFGMKGRGASEEIIYAFCAYSLRAKYVTLFLSNI